MGWTEKISGVALCVVFAGASLSFADDATPEVPTERAERSPTAVERRAPDTSESDPVDEARETIFRKRRRAAPRSLDEAVRRLGAVRVSVDFEDAEFREVVAFIQQVTDFNVIVGPALQKEGLDDVPTVTLRLTDVSVKQLCELVAKATETKLLFNKSRILEFTTPEAARGRPVLRIYSVGEIVNPITNFPGPDLNLRPAGADFEPEEQTVSESPFGDADGVAELVQQLIDSDTWDDDDVSIAGSGNRLIVRQYPHVHRKIRRLLAQLRAAR